MENKVVKFKAKTVDFTNYNVVKNHFYKSFTGIAIIKTPNSKNGFEVVEVAKVRIGATDNAHTVLLNIIPLHYDENYWANGQGKANGYGYHRESRAIEAAFVSAGMKFENPFGGYGHGGEVEAIQAAVQYVAENTIGKNETLISIDVLENGF